MICICTVFKKDVHSLNNLNVRPIWQFTKLKIIATFDHHNNSVCQFDIVCVLAKIGKDTVT